PRMRGREGWGNMGSGFAAFGRAPGMTRRCVQSPHGGRVLRLRRGLDRGALHLVADERLELGEIVGEAAAQIARDLVIGALVGPGAARVEHGGRQVRAALGYEEPEIGALAPLGPGDAAVRRGGKAGSGSG